jgi:hypothetical protein
VPSHGTLEWDINGDGGFTYTPATNFWGTDCFTYEATDGQNNFGTATVTVSVTMANALFSDDFTRCVASSLAPWQVYQGQGVDGQWALGSGIMQGSSSEENYGYCYVSNTWADYSVEAMVQFPAGAFGGGLGGRLNPASGAHYTAWIYPEGSYGGDKVLKLVKFWDWTDWGYNGSAQAPMAEVSLAGPVTNVWHTLKLAFQGAQIQVFYDSQSVTNLTDTDTDQSHPPSLYSSGGVSLDMWTFSTPYSMSVSNLIVTP